MATLNAEPAIPKEREKQHLPPKSYANAVEEEPPASTPPTNRYHGNGSNGKNVKDNGTITTNSKSHKVIGEHDGDGATPGHTASVLRIVDTGAEKRKVVEEKVEEKKASEVKGEKVEEEKEKENRPQVCSRRRRDPNGGGASEVPPRGRHCLGQIGKRNGIH
jgi:hypothetical protein